MSVISHLRLLLWKNYLLQVRHPWMTICELFIPCLFVAMLAAIRLKVDFTYHANVTQYESFDTFFIPEFKIGDNLIGAQWIVMYSPNSTRINRIMNGVAKKMKSYSRSGSSLPKTQAFNSEDEMISFYNSQETYYQNLILCGIIFEDESKLEEKLKYKLRFASTPKYAAKDAMRPIRSWWTQFTFPLFSKPGPRQSGSSTGGIPGYYEEGFLAVQHAVAMTVASDLTNTPNDIDEVVKVFLQRFPYPPYIEDVFLLALQFLFPIILMLSFIYPAVNLTKNLVIEKEKRLKESMKMMGLQNWLHWFAWFIKSFTWLAISAGLLSILITISIKEGVGILNKSNGLLVYLFFISYAISCIAFCFMLSTFFSKANVSAVGSGVLFFIAFMPYFFFFPRYRDLRFIQKMLACLSCNTALAMGSMIIAMWEGNSVGIQWSNLSKTASPDDTLTIQHIIIMFFVDTIIYLTITWYVEAVFPGEYGVPHPWYFPLKKTYWFGKSVESDDKEKLDLNGYENPTAYQTDKSEQKLVNEYFENEPTGLKSGIKIKGLSKTFGKKKFAVKDLSLNAYRSQITALLGHNGAGKTTTMSILTGLFPPSNGTAIINGFDIRTDIDSVRSSLGICPQFDILFDELTVEEHLLFYCKLKNFDKSQASEEITRMIELLGLEDKRKSLSVTLSGGMKRKLSVGIALVGNSKTVILDEPTSGMDIYARRFTWDLLLAEKANRTILLSTHFMEEADVLGERIAIMANGVLQCCGSPLFLKRKYGAGYHMKIVKTSDSTDAMPITRLIQYHIPHAKLETSAGTEISYSLPNEDSSLFEGLFTDLENKKDKLGIDSYGASFTTMEEVFLKVGEYAEEGMKAINDHQNGVLNGDLSINMETKNDERNSGFTLIMQQFYALLMKKILFTYRNPTLTASQIILPMTFAIMVLVLLKDLPKPGDSPNLVLNLNNFKGSEVPYFVKDSDAFDNLTVEAINSYLSQFSGNNRVYKQSFNTTNLTQSTIEYILKISEDNIGYFNLHVPIGVMIESGEDESITYTGLFNNQPFHSSAISLAAVDSAVMRYEMLNPDYTLEVSNHPLPRTTADKLLQIQYQSPEQFQLAENIMFSMSFLAASFAVLLVKEKSIKGKHLQKVCGVKLYIFWITSFIWDFLIYIIPCCLVMLMYYLFDQEPLKSPQQETRLFIVFVVHGFALLPFVYLLSFLFDVPSTAYVRICLYNIIVGIGTFITVVVTELPLLDLKNIGRILDWIFSIFLPNFNLGRSLYLLYTNYLGNKYCNIPSLQKACNLGTVNATEFLDFIRNEFKQFSSLIDEFQSKIPANTNITIPVPDVIKPCCKEKCADNCFPWNANYFGLENPGIGRLLILLIIQSIVFWILIVLVEYHVIRSLKYFLYRIKSNYLNKLKKKEESEGLELVDNVDEDVKAEYDMIDANDMKEILETNAMIIKRLTKYYDNFCAVDHISYGVRRGECFGLLGVNGAGKTTTFKMITGDETISSGDIYVNGFSVKSDIQQVQRQIGYCPQFDGLLDQLTGRETLFLFSRLRGITETNIPHHIEEISKLLYFDMHIDKLVGNYSGGTKRKLSTAVALIGDPSVSFLDEPTTGVDPVARRCLWDALTKKLSRGSSIVLTSHSMEECEALCNRLIIMVNGKICCIGSPQQLKNKFGKGYTVLIKVMTGAPETRVSRSNSETGGRRPSKIAWRQNSIISSDTVLTQNISEVKLFMEKSFPGSELKAIHNNLLHYYISDTQLSWALIFGLIERAKERLNIEDYSIGQTTLEQIFLSFARKQRDLSD